MSKPIALILGSGANLGHHVAGRFRTEGYRVATVSRSKSTANDDETSLSLTCDLADPREVETVFATVRKAWGEPSVVVYNAYSLTNALTPECAFDLSTQDFERHLAVNTTSAFVAVREALSGFKHMGRGNFFYTGNYLPWHSHPKLMTLGVGKAASAHFVQIADEVWSGRGMRFYFVDEREADGTPMWNGVNADAHADFMADLIESGGKEVPWKATFVKGKGYVAFADNGTK